MEVKALFQHQSGVKDSDLGELLMLCWRNDHHVINDSAHEIN
jgi:hypothetical protein